MPYTYLIGWPALGRWYYGVRYSKDCHPDDLLSTYFTSSKSVARFIEEQGLPTVKHIRRVFTSVNAAREWEHKVLRRLRAKDSAKFLNHSDNKSISVEAALRGAKTKKPWKLGDVRRSTWRCSPQQAAANWRNGDPARQKRNTYGPLTESHKAAIAAGLRHSSSAGPGWYNAERGKAMAAKNNAQSGVCPICGKTGQYRALKRWHYENCKLAAK